MDPESYMEWKDLQIKKVTPLKLIRSYFFLGKKPALFWIAMMLDDTINDIWQVNFLV